MQVAVDPEPASTHVDVKDPRPVGGDSETSPVGVIVVPRDVSVTVAVHELAWFTTTGVAQARVMLVVLRLTVMLAAWLLLPE